MITLSFLENSPKGFSKLFQTQPLVLKADWSKKLLPFKIEYYLAYSAKKLFFGAKVFRKTIWKYPYKKGVFKEGLYQRDVLELFLSKKGEKGYWELNLDPNAAFWVKEFSAYRKQSTNKIKLNSIQTYSSINPQFWQAALAIDFSAIPFKTKSLQSLEVNICSIIGRNQRYYLSYNRPSSGKPDFHQRALIKKIKLLTQKNDSRLKRRNS